MITNKATRRANKALLDDLPDEDLERVWRAVGGHPRTLEYLDALLAGGQGRLGDITRRLHASVTDRLGAEAATVWFTTDRDLDAALADVVTLAADDVLLPALWAGLSTDARRLLIGLSVFREPVDFASAALFAVGDLDDTAAWTPDRHAAEERIRATFAAHGLDLEALNQAFAAGTLDCLPRGVAAALQPDLDELVAPPRPPRSTTLNLPALVGELAESSLLSLDPEAGSVFVHRWTATEIHRILGPDTVDDTRRAHQHAAEYWQWRVEAWPQDQPADIHDLLEARRHHHAAGDDDAADEITRAVCSQLDTWGAWDHEHSLIVETRTWLGPTHPSESIYLYMLGLLAQKMGDPVSAEGLYESSLVLSEERESRERSAATYHQLGMLAQERGDYPGAEQALRRALAIKNSLQDPVSTAVTRAQLAALSREQGNYESAIDTFRECIKIFGDANSHIYLAATYGQLGLCEYARGDLEAAESACRESLAINEEMGNHHGSAICYHQLGNLACERANYDESETFYRQALTIFERLGNQAGMASSYHQLGVLARARGDYETAETSYHQALTIKERLGSQAGMATSYGQLGILAQARGDYETAETYYRQSLTIFERLGNQSGIATTWSQLGILRTTQGRPAESVSLHIRALAVRLGIGIPQARIDAQALVELRTVLGPKVFAAEVAAVLDGESAQQLMSLLDGLTDGPK